MPLVSECVEPTDLPSPPEGPLSVSQVTRTSAALTWKPSRSDGGSSLRGYLVEKREERRDVWTEVDKVDAETLSVKANGLIEGRATFSV
ncbi:hypothetical protein BaRGS_00030978 [Batillaria attramentaria]|uniref:Fibronectin type-III domain-containing protein n=1 Tax=Batillaria attramentaria TaxID=370345 RepID=A0ABD0JSY6_9CAEN